MFGFIMPISVACCHLHATVQSSIDAAQLILLDHLVPANCIRTGLHQYSSVANVHASWVYTPYSSVQNASAKECLFRI
ncbi:hypothetical protein IWX47DRAFT_871379 [Phyllosticta citricarpa]